MVNTTINIKYQNTHSLTQPINTSFPSLLVGYHLAFATGGVGKYIKGDGSSTLAELLKTKTGWLDIEVLEAYSTTDTTTAKADPFSEGITGWTKVTDLTAATVSKTYYAVKYRHNPAGSIYKVTISATDLPTPANSGDLPNVMTLNLKDENPDITKYYVSGGLGMLPANIKVTREDDAGYIYRIEKSYTDSDADLELSIPILYKAYHEPVLIGTDYANEIGGMHRYNQMGVALELYFANSGSEPVYIMLTDYSTTQYGPFFSLDGTHLSDLLYDSLETNLFSFIILDSVTNVGGIASAFVGSSLHEQGKPIMTMLGYGSWTDFAIANSVNPMGTRTEVSAAIKDGLLSTAASYNNPYIKLVFPPSIGVSIDPTGALTSVPGYFYGVAYAGAISRFGTDINMISVPMTGMKLNGITSGLYDGLILMSDDRKVVSNNGVWLIDSRGRCVHQSTTSIDSIEQNEDSIVRTALWIGDTIGALAKQIVTGGGSAPRNITPDLLNTIKQNIDVFTSMHIVSVVAAPDTRLVSVTQDETDPTKVNIVYNYKPLYPANSIAINIVV